MRAPEQSGNGTRAGVLTGGGLAPRVRAAVHRQMAKLSPGQRDELRGHALRAPAAPISQHILSYPDAPTSAAGHTRIPQTTAVHHQQANEIRTQRSRSRLLDFPDTPTATHSTPGRSLAGYGFEAPAQNASDRHVAREVAQATRHLDTPGRSIAKTTSTDLPLLERFGRLTALNPPVQRAGQPDFGAADRLAGKGVGSLHSSALDDIGNFFGDRVHDFGQAITDPLTALGGILPGGQALKAIPGADKTARHAAVKAVDFGAKEGLKGVAAGLNLLNALPSSGQAMQNAGLPDTNEKQALDEVKGGGQYLLDTLSNLRSRSSLGQGTPAVREQGFVPPEAAKALKSALHGTATATDFAFRQFNRFPAAGADAALYAQAGKDPLTGLEKGFTGADGPVSWSDPLRKAGASPQAAAGAGLLADMALNPLTYGGGELVAPSKIAGLAAMEGRASEMGVNYAELAAKPHPTPSEVNVLREIEQAGLDAEAMHPQQGLQARVGFQGNVPAAIRKAAGQGGSRAERSRLIGHAIPGSHAAIKTAGGIGRLLTTEGMRSLGQRFGLQWIPIRPPGTSRLEWMLQNRAWAMRLGVSKSVAARLGAQAIHLTNEAERLGFNNPHDLPRVLAAIEHGNYAGLSPDEARWADEFNAHQAHIRHLTNEAGVTHGPGINGPREPTPIPEPIDTSQAISARRGAKSEHTRAQAELAKAETAASENVGRTERGTLAMTGHTGPAAAAARLLRRAFRTGDASAIPELQTGAHGATQLLERLTAAREAAGKATENLATSTSTAADLLQQARARNAEIRAAQKAAEVDAGRPVGYVPHVPRSTIESIQRGDAHTPDVAAGSLQTGDFRNARSIPKPLDEMTPQEREHFYTDNIGGLLGHQVSQVSHDIGTKTWQDRVASFAQPIHNEGDLQALGIHDHPDELRHRFFVRDRNGFRPLFTTREKPTEDAVRNAVATQAARGRTVYGIEKNAWENLKNLNQRGKRLAAPNSGTRLFVNSPLQTIKRIQTVDNPGFHVRNTLGEMWLGRGAGMTATDWARASRYLPELRRQASIFGKRDQRTWEDLGHEGEVIHYPKAGDMTMPQVIRRGLEHHALTSGFGGSDYMFSPEDIIKGKMPGHLRALTQDRENIARLAMFEKRLRMGDDVTTAAEISRQHLFDYSNLTPHEVSYGRLNMPYYTFFTRNVPRQVRQVGGRPGQFANLAAAQNESAKAQGQKPDWQSVMPFYRQMGIPLFAPFKVGGLPVNLFPRLPAIDLNVLSPQSPGDVAKDLVGRINPFFQTPLEILTNQNFFTQEPLTGTAAADSGVHYNAPSFVKDLPPSLQKLLGVSSYTDPRTGKETTSWSGVTDLLARQFPQSSAILNFATPNHNRHQGSQGLGLLSAAGLPSSVQYDRTQYEIQNVAEAEAPLYARKAQLESDLRKRPTPEKLREYVELGKKLTPLQALMFKLKQQEGYKFP